MPLSEKQKRDLKRQAHHLKPVVIVGQHGLSDNVHQEIDIALSHHELIKVRVNAGDRPERAALVAEIVQRSGSERVLEVGHIIALFRRNPDKPKINLIK